MSIYTNMNLWSVETEKSYNIVVERLGTRIKNKAVSASSVTLSKSAIYPSLTYLLWR